MKILIFSDSHLYNRFEQKKFAFLRYLITSVDHVIINGDYWDGYIIHFDEFLTTPWNRLFPLLKERGSIYIYGNHDQVRPADSRVNLFSAVQLDHHQLKIGQSLLLLEHGHRFQFSVPKRTRRIKRPSSIFKWLDLLEGLAINTIGPRYLQIRYQNLNNEIKQQLTTQTTSNQWFICGHTHCCEVDRENRFINTGVFKHGLAQYILIEGDILTLQQAWYNKRQRATILQTIQL